MRSCSNASLKARGDKRHMLESGHQRAKPLLVFGLSGGRHRAKGPAMKRLLCRNNLPPVLRLTRAVFAREFQRGFIRFRATVAKKDTATGAVGREQFHQTRLRGGTGFKYWFTYTASGLPIHRLLDRQTWKLGGNLDDITLYLLFDTFCRNPDHGGKYRMEQLPAVKVIAITCPGH